MSLVIPIPIVLLKIFSAKRLEKEAAFFKSDVELNPKHFIRLLRVIPSLRSSRVGGVVLVVTVQETPLRKLIEPNS